MLSATSLPVLSQSLIFSTSDSSFQHYFLEVYTLRFHENRLYPSFSRQKNASPLSQPCVPKFSCYKLLKKSLSKQQQRKHPLSSRHNLPKFNCMLQSIRVLKLFRKEAGRTQSRNHCFPLASTSEVAELFQLTFCKEKIASAHSEMHNL